MDSIGIKIDSSEVFDDGLWDELLLRARHAIGNIFLAGWGELDRNGLLIQSFSASSLGIITLIQSKIYIPDADCRKSTVGDILHVYGDIYMCVYYDAEHAQTKVFTFTCNSSGELGVAVIDSLTVGSGYWWFEAHPSVCRVEGATDNIFAIARTSSPGIDGYIDTIKINNDGTIDPVLDTWKFDALNTHFNNKIMHRHGTVYALYVTGSGTRSRIYTFNIANDGTLPPIDLAGYIDTEMLDYWVLIVSGDMIQVNGDLFTASIVKTGSGGWVYTFTISEAGVISSVIDSWAFGGSNSYDPSLMVFGDNEAGDGKIVAIAHVSFGDGEYNLKLIEILNNGTITKSIIKQKSLVSSPDLLTTPFFVDINGIGNFILLVYIMADFLPDFTYRGMMETWEVISPVSYPFTASRAHALSREEL